MTRPDASRKSRIVVDTDVASYLFSDRPQATFFKPYLANRTLALSFMTVGQMYYGAYRNGWGTRKLEKLEGYMKNYVILPFDYDLCLEWARLRSDGEADGQCIEHGDCWIAASALRHDCALATNNGKHFKHIKNLALICPGLF